MRARVQPQVLAGEEAVVARDRLAAPEAVDDVERLVHARALLARRGPGVADRHLVEPLARADAEEHAAGEQALERRPRLRDQPRVVARAGRRDARAEQDRPRRLPRRAEPRPRVGRLAALPPRLEMVGGREAVEPALLGLDGLAQKVLGREVLLRGLEEVPGRRHAVGLPRRPLSEAALLAGASLRRTWSYVRSKRDAHE